ncbi:arabinogalactan endo-1,4-beta-galactosidase [Prevotella sp. PINT]|uniref:glycosyl hydrolase 53 family protein n=1 Tax=Palleniella intestinalis TaxID=2736291 RepID=UPI001554EC00|nr:glycosyl hydrolase 53 family protein [Palleniella intestinalis]NPD81030.1 arabinogalactan endo-1,4-beta-galactosidase [Palleniella intestinalis]
MRMSIKKLLAGLLFVATSVQAQERYVGGDISLLPDYVNAGAKYFDHEGSAVVDFLPWCHEEGMNTMRVRLFVNPKKYKELHANDNNADTRYDSNACQDIGFVLPLCQDIVNAGHRLMLDFHYSDTWADPAKQWIPIEWENMNDEQLCDKIYEYTKESLLTLKEAGVTPAFIQPGNEISYGMLWGKLGTTSPKKAFMGSNANWDRFGKLLSRAIEACREVVPSAKIVLHTERVLQIDVMTNFYRKMQEMNVDYDVIGLSYYPFWHGDMTQLDKALTALETEFTAKNIMIVETGYGLKWQVPYNDIIDHTSIWPISDAGQMKFTQDLVATVEKHKSVNGLLWWWMEYNPYNTNLSGWYNASLFDPTTGRASSAFHTLCSYGSSGTGIDGITKKGNNEAIRWYNLHGQHVDASTPGLLISKDRKKINR